MFSLISSAFFCSAPKTDYKDEEVKTYQRGTLQNIATAIDIIVGLGLIATGFALNMPVLTMVGALQLWPLCAFVTVVLFSAKEGKFQENIYLKLRPCCKRDASETREV